MLLCGFHWHPGIVFAFFFMFSVSFIGFIQYHVGYSELIKPKVTIMACPSLLCCHEKLLTSYCPFE